MTIRIHEVGSVPAVKKHPSYHDLHITTPLFARTSIFNLPFNLVLMCTRTGGWELWDAKDGIAHAKLLSGEYAGKDKWIILDVDGEEIVNSYDRTDDEDDES